MLQKGGGGRKMEGKKTGILIKSVGRVNGAKEASKEPRKKKPSHG